MANFWAAMMKARVENDSEHQPPTKKPRTSEFSEMLIAASALLPTEEETVHERRTNSDTESEAMDIDPQNIADGVELFHRTEDIHFRRFNWSLNNLKDEISTHSSILANSFPPSSIAEAEQALNSADDCVRMARARLLGFGRMGSRGHRSKESFDNCQGMLSKLEADILEWRSQYPDKSAVKIDNRRHFCDASGGRHAATLIAYTTALAGRVFNGTSEAGSGFLLKALKLFGSAVCELSGGPNIMQNKAIEDIPVSITTLEQRLNLGIESVPYAVCPSLKCQYLHKPLYPPGSSTPIYPEECGHRLFPSSVACEEPLLSNGKPILTFHYYSFLDWFGRFIATPGIESLGDQFCEEVDESPTAPSTKRRASDGSHIRDIRGPQGEHFLLDRGKEGRWLFRLFVDDFNLEGNRLGGKHRSTTVIAMSCLNLPLKMANDPAYIYLAGLVQATVQADVRAALHGSENQGEDQPSPSIYLRPLIDDMVLAYDRGLKPCATHSSHITPTSFSNSSRIFRIALALASMDLKAARPEAGLRDIMSDLYCFVCDCWHRSYLHRTDYEDWNCLDDAELRSNATLWTEATDEKQRKDIRRQYGTRDSELWRLPYWQPTKQLVVDPMHTIFLVILPRHFRFGLGIEDMKRPFQVLFSYPFTLPPHPSKIAKPTNKSDIPKELAMIISGGDVSLSLLRWEISEADERPRVEFAHAIRDNSDPLNLAEEVEKVHSKLSGPHLITFNQELKRFSLKSLRYVSNDLCLFDSDSSRKGSKDELVKALDEWRGRVVQESFQWPFFTLKDGSSHLAPLPVDPQGSKPTRRLSEGSRKHLLEALPQYITYDSAHAIGKLHDYLTRNPDYLNIDLEAKLSGEPLDALRYVCVDVNRMPPMGEKWKTKKPFVDQLVQWHDEQVRLNEMPRHIEFSQDEGLEVLQRIHLALEKVIVPSWVSRPPPEIGLASAGKPRAADWRTLYAIYLPLALLSLWQKGSPIAHRRAPRRRGPLIISMALTCASIVLVKQTLSEERRELFRKCLSIYMKGLKEFFPNAEIATATSHIAFHIYEFMELFANSHYWWCFPFESLIGKLQRLPKNHKLGEQEKTILHSFYKGAYFRRWLKRPDAPTILKTCRDLLDTAYGFVSEPVLSREDTHGATSDSDEVESDSDMNIASDHEEQRSRVAAPHGIYSIPNLRSVGNSYICYHPKGNARKKWVAGQIQAISACEGNVWLEVKRSADFKQHQNSPDPFSEFWEQGFEAMMVSSHYVEKVDKVNKDWIVGHTARWELDAQSVIVLNLSQE